ncbi:hypothetical protein PG993_007496 [Apiospora rasikravindrae]|uniref:Uncharacterized protein n=1 Tax=Apiospora rasikravindrae TaxID=990691 RepID=A0ABR1SXN4_9PEZI
MEMAGKSCIYMKAGAGQDGFQKIKTCTLRKADYSAFVSNRDDRTGGADTTLGFFHLFFLRLGVANLDAATAEIANAFNNQAKEKTNSSGGGRITYRYLHVAGRTSEECEVALAVAGTDDKRAAF